MLKPNVNHHAGGKIESYFNIAFFQHLWPEMKPKIQELLSVNPSYEVWVPGISMGGVFASLTSVELAYHNMVDPSKVKKLSFDLLKTVLI